MIRSYIRSFQILLIRLNYRVWLKTKLYKNIGNQAISHFWPPMLTGRLCQVTLASLDASQKYLPLCLLVMDLIMCIPLVFLMRVVKIGAESPVRYHVKVIGTVPLCTLQYRWRSEFSVAVLPMIPRVSSGIDTISTRYTGEKEH